jgi:hypothetical protein
MARSLKVEYGETTKARSVDTAPMVKHTLFGICSSKSKKLRTSVSFSGYSKMALMTVSSFSRAPVTV